ncbi:ADP-ribose glycohydrolase MACROD2 [Brienomyrus brachyistius]|uniref:ADP-ribose glycohydrolase MACROD2 n=1 Tax=Brienomyrus brachyistius TaxID=42636 RepID=UPI0020B310C8|nr:ADP-ribose glycohydrolase MACROD2 [Brienomyrus brachyistius]
MSKKKKDWSAEKARLLDLGLEERRKEYKGSHVPLEDILTWTKHERSKGKEESVEQDIQANLLSDKVSLYKGDITVLEVDAIVNAANSTLLGGGGVDGCIHKAAGPCLYDECHTLNGCETGNAKITGGYDLPAKYVIHTVGPVARGYVGKAQKELLSQCYQNSLALVKEYDLRSVAFPCISTGIYGFPNEPAAEIALSTVKTWLKKNTEIDRVIFCVFLETDFKIYKEKMSHFFSKDKHEDVDEEGAVDEGKKDTPPSKKYKNKKQGSDEENVEEREQEKGEVEDIQMESQTECSDSTFDGDVEMSSQAHDEQEKSPEHSMDNKDMKDKDIPSGKSEEKHPMGGQLKEEGMDCAADTAVQAGMTTESQSSPDADGSKCPSAETAAEQVARCLDTDTEGDSSGDSQKPVSDSDTPVDEGETHHGQPAAQGEDTSAFKGPPAELSTQGEESEVMQPDRNQSKDP